MIDFAIRRLRPDDSLDGLTGLLHRAYSESRQAQAGAMPSRVALQRARP